MSSGWFLLIFAIKFWKVSHRKILKTPSSSICNVPFLNKPFIRMQNRKGRRVTLSNGNPASLDIISEQIFSFLLFIIQMSWQYYYLYFLLVFQIYYVTHAKSKFVRNILTSTRFFIHLSPMYGSAVLRLLYRPSPHTRLMLFYSFWSATPPVFSPFFFLILLRVHNHFLSHQVLRSRARSMNSTAWSLPFVVRAICRSFALRFLKSCLKIRSWFDLTTKF